ncbi:hypothetical protein MN116_004972 [Schistosoma mekongi]|uniref:G-protein coupled receptors family 1 profile domain-containing protein n=1 Tax=Schistosoma mekongi TaxID=38744 RepID=A0AAE1ZCZ7_SCHME|nr:hypothetical protein MN116_004972 [Schistosoma mekongi]
MNESFNQTLITCNQMLNFTQFMQSPLTIISFSITTFINLGIIATNLFMIIILLITKNKRFDATRKFLINLSIIDISFALYIMPISIMYIILKMNWISCYIVCHLWIISDVYLCSTNMLNLVIIAFDRMLAVKYAVKYNQIMSPTRVRLLILLIWLLALISILPLVIYIIWNQLSTTTSLSSSTINIMNIISHNKQSLYSYNYHMKCLQYQCSLINVSVYIRLFITVFSMYIPTILMCYFYFHVFSKVIINKRGISLGLLIDKDTVYHRKSDKKNISPKDSINIMNSNDMDNNTPIKINNTNGKQDKFEKNNHSKCNFLRVHVGGKQLQLGNNTIMTTNYHYNSNTNINTTTTTTNNNNNNNKDNNHMSQTEKLIINNKNENNNDPYVTSKTSSKNVDNEFCHEQQQQPSSVLNQQIQHSALTIQVNSPNNLQKSDPSEDLRKAFRRFILHCGKVKREKKALKRLVLAGLGAAGIPYGHRIIIPQMKSNDNNKSVVFNKPLIIADTEEKM